MQEASRKRVLARKRKSKLFTNRIKNVLTFILLFSFTHRSQVQEEGDDARTMMASSSYAEEGSTEEAKGEGKEGEEGAMPEMIACEGPAGNVMTTNANENLDISIPGMMMRSFFGDGMDDSTFSSSRHCLVKTRLQTLLSSVRRVKTISRSNRLTFPAASFESL